MGGGGPDGRRRRGSNAGGGGCGGAGGQRGWGGAAARVGGAGGEGRQRGCECARGEVFFPRGVRHARDAGGGSGIAQLACICGIIFLRELVANSPKIAHLFGCYLSYLG
jgi:hypothetical protein